MRDPVQIAVIAAAVALMVLWFFTMPDQPPPGSQPPAAPPRAEAPAPPPAPATGAMPAPASSPAPPSAAAVTQAMLTTIENDAVRLRVSNLGGRVESIELLGYADRIGEEAGRVQLVTAGNRGTLQVFLGDGAFGGSEASAHEAVAVGRRRVSYVLNRNGVEIRRTLELDDVGYGGRLRVSVSNRSNRSVEPRFELALYGRARDSDAPDYFQNYQLVTSADGDLERRPLAGIGSPGFFDNLFGGGGAPQGEVIQSPVDWGGIESQYFLLAAVPENPRESSGFQGPVAQDTGLSLLRYPTFEVPPGRQVERVYRLYFGPKLNEQVAAVDSRLESTVQVGWQWVRPLVRGFAGLLVWFHDNVIANYGVAIIVLTILLRVATYPLTQKSMRSMKRFGQIAPLMKELQEKYKGDKQKLSEEMMSLYKKQGINPLTAMGGGCLPMLIQMPFMIALYFALQGSIELRHAPFMLWIQDLSAPEDFFSIAGIPIRALPLVMGGSMLLQQRLTPTTGDPQQRQMMMWMSVIFTFMFYQFPSGLLLYWFVSNLLGIGQQFLVNRTPAKKASA